MYIVPTGTPTRTTRPVCKLAVQWEHFFLPKVFILEHTYIPYILSVNILRLKRIYYAQNNQQN